jgi:tetratricopeptide (TPR) repeat protein
MDLWSSGRKRRWALLCAAALIVSAGPFWAPWVAARYYLYRGRRALQLYQTDAGRDWLIAAEKLDPDDAETQFFLGRACRRKGEYDDAFRHLEQAVRLGFPALRIERERRLAIAQTARVREVQDYLPEMLTSPGDDGSEICAAYVHGFFLNLDFAAANKILDAWTADFADDPEPHFRRGDFWYGQNEWPAAIPAYEKCLQLDPSRTKARENLAQCLMKMNEPARAEPHFRRCLKEAPDDLQVWLGLGTCLMTLGRADEARRALEHIVERSSRHGGARQRLAELELQSGRPEAALEWAGPVAREWPDDAALATLMAQALQETGHAENARKFWEVVRRGEQAAARLDKLTTEVRKHPADLELRYRIGAMFLRYRSREEGVTWLKSVLQYDPRHRAAHRMLADYYSRIGEAELAHRHQRAADEVEVSRGS